MIDVAFSWRLEFIEPKKVQVLSNNFLDVPGRDSTLQEKAFRIPIILLPARPGKRNLPASLVSDDQTG